MTARGKSQWSPCAGKVGGRALKNATGRIACPCANHATDVLLLPAMLAGCSYKERRLLRTSSVKTIDLQAYGCLVNYSKPGRLLEGGLCRERAFSWC